MFYILIIIALLTSAMYGFGTSPVLLYLNTSAIRSWRSAVILSLGLITVYATVCFLPLMLLETGILLFVTSNIRMVIVATFMCMLIVLVVINHFNINRYQEICPPKATRLLNVYLLFLILLFVSLGITSFFASTNPLLPLIVAGSFIPITALFCTALLSSDYGFQKPHLSEATYQKLKNNSLAKDRKVLWFGIDSATWDILDEMMAQKRLPHLAKLRKNGSSGRLKTFKPTFSPVLWTSKATGKSPRKHGVRNFVLYRIKGMNEYLELIGIEPFLAKLMTVASKFRIIRIDPVTSLKREALAIWNILSSFDYKVNVLSWFLTDPVEPIKGVMIPEFFYTFSEKKQGMKRSQPYPPDVDTDISNIKARVRTRFESPAGTEEVMKRFDIQGSLLTPKDRRNFEVLKVFYFQDILRLELLNHFIENSNSNLIMVYFHGVDAAQHRFWDSYNTPDSQFQKVIPRYYEFIDDILGELLEKIEGQKTVFITSDHGHEAANVYVQMINRLLGRQPVSGSHANAPDGIFIASGQDITPEVRLDDISLYDIVPTLLPLFSLPIARDMDGQPMEEILLNTIPKPSYIDTYEGLPTLKIEQMGEIDEKEEVLQRLRDLGYID